MIQQYDNYLFQSYALFLDNLILSKGQAYTNYSTTFYPNSQVIFKVNGVNYNNYASPFSQIISDWSISGANILTGIYIGNNFYGTGRGGFSSINYEKGQVYCTGSSVTGTVSGNIAIKDFNIYMTASSEDQMLFDTKPALRPKWNAPFTGINNNNLTYPAIFIRNLGGNNVPFQFGGTENTSVKIRGMIMADSDFQLHGASSIIRDSIRRFFPLFSGDYPFNQLGMTVGTGYNYQQLVNSKTKTADKIWIKDVTITNFLQDLGFSPSVFCGFFDIVLEQPRITR